MVGSEAPSAAPMATEPRWTSRVAMAIPTRTGSARKRVAKVRAMSWLLSPSSATKITAKLSRKASTGRSLAAFDAPEGRRTLAAPSRVPVSYRPESPMADASPSPGRWAFRPLPPEPRSVVELIRAGTLDAELAATLWVLIEGRVPVVVAGARGRRQVHAP